MKKFAFLFIIVIICFSCKERSLEIKYNYWISNNDFKQKEELIEAFERTLYTRLSDSLNFPEINFLNEVIDWEINENILLNTKSDKAVILIMSIGLDNRKDTIGGVYVVSGQYLSDQWIINDKIDMTFYYFTHHYDEKLTFDKISELSTKRMIDAGYMKSSNKFNREFVDDNWNHLFHKN